MSRGTERPYKVEGMGELAQHSEVIRKESKYFGSTHRPLISAPFVIVSGRRIEGKWELQALRGVVRATVHFDVTDMAVHEAQNVRSIIEPVLFPWRRRFMLG